MKRGVIFLAIIAILAMNLVLANSYFLEFNQEGLDLAIKESINNVQNKNYVDSESLNFAGKEIYFLNKIVFSENFESARIRINLEKGVVIKENEIFPAGYKIETDGQTISIIWGLSNVKQGDTFAIFVNLEDTKKNSFSYALIGFGLIVLAGVVWFVFSSQKNKKKITRKITKKKRNKNEKIHENYGYLLDTEKKVIEELKKADRNELWQKQIKNSTGFSKAKVSRLIRNLEARELIVKIPFGNTNKIRLK